MGHVNGKIYIYSQHNSLLNYTQTVNDFVFIYPSTTQLLLCFQKFSQKKIKDINIFMYHITSGEMHIVYAAAVKLTLHFHIFLP